ncbi:MAG: hypothetical protein LBK73_06965 [Treponema sp.]|jgi:hypothetical protein|nr:hypothetical protein [Treponema sp.]
MKINKRPFGAFSNEKKIELYTLSAGELALSVSTLGATLTSLYAPSRKTGVEDILLVDEHGVPTGELAKADLTPFDFRLWKPIPPPPHRYFTNKKWQFHFWKLTWSFQRLLKFNSCLSGKYMLYYTRWIIHFI